MTRTTLYRFSKTTGEPHRFKHSDKCLISSFYTVANIVPTNMYLTGEELMKSQIAPVYWLISWLSLFSASLGCRQVFQNSSLIIVLNLGSYLLQRIFSMKILMTAGR